MQVNPAAAGTSRLAAKFLAKESAMAGSVNKVILVGNVGKDPEIRRTQDGRPIANLSIATSESWRDKATGEKKEKTEWHRVVIFSEPLCKIVEQYVKKGAKLYIEGALQTRKWTDKDGAEKYSTEVVLQGFNGSLTMLDGAGGGRGASGGLSGGMGGMQESGGGDYDAGGGGFGSGGGGGYSEPAPKRVTKTGGGASAGGGSKGGFDKALDDEIPF
jgi:single-strand DNA-binding protein